MKGREMFYTINDALGKAETRLIINEAIFTHAEKLLIYYAKEYQERPKELLNCFLKYGSIRMAVTLIIFTCRRNGVLKELEGKKDFSEWVGKQKIEERWKPVMENFLLILWGVTNPSPISS